MQQCTEATRQRAVALMEVIHERGRKGIPLERLYRHLFNPELYLRAYGKIYRNTAL